MTAPLNVPEQDPSTIPGAIQIAKTRTLPDGTLIEFEHAPAGWLTKAGEVRMRDWHAYYYSTPCVPCDGDGRVDGKSPKSKLCQPCKGTGTRRGRMPSVTTLLDAICPKPGLAPWYEMRGIEGAVEAVRLGLIDPEDPASVARAIETVRGARLGADRARDDAAARGLNVHACLEQYMLTGDAPNPADHPREHWGYLRALTRWLLKADPEPRAVEELVVHPEDGYAGRLDLRAAIDGLLYTVDAKSQEKGGIYLGAHAQVNLYERAAIWCGDDPADRLLVVVFAENGEFREMPADHRESFTDAALGWVREAKPVDSACEGLNRVEREARKVAA